jgi:hypothetical protein
MYHAFENGFCDEWRRFYRTLEGKLKRESEPELIEVADNPQDRHLTRLTVIKLVEMAEVEATRPSSKAILGATARMVRNSPESLVELNARQIQAEIVRVASRERGVSVRQARYDLESMQLEAENKGLMLLRETLRDEA